MRPVLLSRWTQNVERKRTCGHCGICTISQCIFLQSRTWSIQYWNVLCYVKSDVRTSQLARFNAVTSLHWQTLLLFNCILSSLKQDHITSFAFCCNITTKQSKEQTKEPIRTMQQIYITTLQLTSLWNLTQDLHWGHCFAQQCVYYTFSYITKHVFDLTPARCSATESPRNFACPLFSTLLW